MPIYEYQCRRCERRVEVLQKISDPPLADCPECGRPELRKLVSAASFRLKGGGWYETDFKHSGRRPAAGGEGEDGGKDGEQGGKEGKEGGKKGKDGKDGKKDKSSGKAGTGDAGKAASGGKAAAGGEASP